MKPWRCIVGMSLSLLMSCGVTDNVTSIYELVGDGTRGASLYNANCAQCHGPQGTMSANAAREAKSNPKAAISIILRGEDSMPSFEGKLSNQDIADIVAYLKTL